MSGSLEGTAVAESSVVAGKRKAYSSCDTCKLRRVRCDRDSDDVPCAKCVEKGINCTTAGPRRKKPRTGKRIEQAKELFGDDSQNPNDSPDGDRHSSEEGWLQHAHLSNGSTESSLSLIETVSQLSAHLIEVYFSSTHYNIPLYRWTDFRQKFEDAGRRPDKMSPTAEALAATIIAYGARVSNAPAILGSDAPSLIDLDKQEPNLASWGRRRDAVCFALSERAINLADQRGLFRLESNESIVTLLLLELLIDRAYLHQSSSERFDGRPYRTSSMGHVRTMSEDPSRTQEYRELQQNGLGWHIFMRDAFDAAREGRMPRLHEDDIQILCRRKIVPGLPTVPDFARALNGEALIWDPVAHVWDNIAFTIRQFAIAVADQSTVPDRRAASQFSQAIWEMYKSLDETTDCMKLMQSLLTQFFTARRPGYIWFKFWCRSMRLAIIWAVYLAQKAIKREMQTLDEEVTRATLVPMDELGLDAQEEGRRRSDLLTLKAESDKRMVLGARELACMLYSFQNSLASRTGLGIMTGVHLLYDCLLDWAQILCNLPVRETGGPADYSLDTKIQEVGWMLSSYRSLGWAWGDLTDTIKYVERQYDALKDLRASLTVAPNPFAVDVFAGLAPELNLNLSMDVDMPPVQPANINWGNADFTRISDSGYRTEPAIADPLAAIGGVGGSEGVTWPPGSSLQALAGAGAQMNSQIVPPSPSFDDLSNWAQSLCEQFPMGFDPSNAAAA